jgi:hypothetical protein
LKNSLIELPLIAMILFLKEQLETGKKEQRKDLYSGKLFTILNISLKNHSTLKTKTTSMQKTNISKQFFFIP